MLSEYQHRDLDHWLLEALRRSRAGDTRNGRSPFFAEKYVTEIWGAGVTGRELVSGAKLCIRRDYQKFGRILMGGLITVITLIFLLVALYSPWEIISIALPFVSGLILMLVSVYRLLVCDGHVLMEVRVLLNQWKTPKLNYVVRLVAEFRILGMMILLVFCFLVILFIAILGLDFLGDLYPLKIALYGFGVCLICCGIIELLRTGLSKEFPKEMERLGEEADLAFDHYVCRHILDDADA